MMKKLIVSSFLLTLVLISLNNAAFAASAEVGKITANASEVTYVLPDTATVSFTVETVDRNSEKAVELNNQKAKELIAALKSMLAENETIKTSEYNLHPKYEYNQLTKKSDLVGYEVTNTLSVTLKDTQKVGKVINVASKNEINNVSGLSFSIQSTDAVCKELTAKAALKAKQQAQDVLTPLGKTVGKIASISYGCSTNMSYRPYRNYVMAKAPSADANVESVSVEQGKNKVEANVTIVFTIKEGFC